MIYVGAIVRIAKKCFTNQSMNCKTFFYFIFYELYRVISRNKKRRF